MVSPCTTLESGLPVIWGYLSETISVLLVTSTTNIVLHNHKASSSVPGHIIMSSLVPYYRVRTPGNEETPASASKHKRKRLGSHALVAATGDSGGTWVRIMVWLLVGSAETVAGLGRIERYVPGSSTDSRPLLASVTIRWLPAGGHGNWQTVSNAGTGISTTWSRSAIQKW